MSARHDPAWRAARAATLRPPLAVAALLLFLWPLVRMPRLPLADAWLHLFGAWALLIVAIFALAKDRGA